MTVNGPVPEGTFSRPFPAGMPVVDLNTKDSYIAGADGQLVPVQPVENAGTQPAVAAPEAATRAGRIVVFAVAGVLLATLVAVRLRRRVTTHPSE